MATHLYSAEQWFSRMFKINFLLVIMMVCLPAFAVSDRYPFESRADELRYEKLLLELRCTVCQNQSLAESNAPLAEDLRQEVYKQIIMGKSNPDIKAYLVERYGPTVLYEPPLQKNTLLLWIGPLVLLLMGAIIWRWKFK